MAGCAHKPRVLVLSEDDLLYRVIDLALGDCDVSRARPSAGSDPHAHGTDVGEIWDLIVLGLGAAPVEPVVALAQTSLLGCVGRVPLLIVSNRQTRPDPEAAVYGLGFPFDVRELAGAVHRIVRRAASGGGRAARAPEGLS